MTLPTRLIAISLFTFGTANSMAQPNKNDETQSEWQYSLGMAAISAPKSLGSDQQKVRALPTFQIKYQDWFFIDPIRGIGVQSKALVDGVNANAALGIDLTERKSKDDARFEGLGDIKMAPSLRLGMNYKFGKSFINTNFISRLGDENGRGLLFEAELGYTLFASPKGFISLGAYGKAMNKTYAQNFFGVTAKQSMASGLKVFSADSGLQSSGLFVQTFVPLTEKWTALGRFSQGQLQGDAATSPIIQNRHQTQLLAAFNYKF